MKRPTAEMLLNAYAQGIFPMAHEDEDWEVYWYSPDPRTIFPLNEFHIPRRLKQIVRQKVFDVRINTAFRDVMLKCAEPRDKSPGIWISPHLVEAYTELHELGFAHSVECWQDDELVGGLYGVSIRGLFAGESMFTRVDNASKVALVHLVERMKERGLTLLDTQFTTEHLKKFGSREIPRTDYEELLEAALQVDVTFA